MALPTTVNVTFADEDTRLWKEYKKSPTPANFSKLFERFSGLVNNQVNKWAGPVPRDVLLNEARIIAKKAFDTYKPGSGAALGTWLTNCLLSLSRTVYTYQNTARMPENITMKVNAYNSAVDGLKTTLGREPTTDELQNELGWASSEVTRMRDYNHKNLIESGPAVSGKFFDGLDNLDDDLLLSGIYLELNPTEKKLFEHTTGYNGAKVMSNPELQKTLGMSIAQLSYQKTLLKNKIARIMSRPGIKKRFA